MATKWKLGPDGKPETWPGGRIRIDEEGKQTWVLERMHEKRRYTITLEAKTLDDAKVEAALFDRDPDETVRVLKDAVRRARLGNDDRMRAIRALDAQARALEARTTAGSGAASPDDFFYALVAEERARSAGYGGMSVFGPERTRKAAPPSEMPAPLAAGPHPAASQ